ncbi:MAG: transglutaminase-like domain-containing protein [Planctomycetota bacterium]|jgi:hypothetical protein
MRDFLIALCVVFCVGRCGQEDRAPAAGDAARAADTVVERWAVLHMMGKPVGHVQTRVHTTADSVETTVASEMTIKRLGAEITVDQTQSTVERPDGQLVSMRTSMKMSAAETKSEITFKDGKAHMVTTVMGSRRESTLDCPADAVGPARVELITAGLAKRPGAKAEVSTFSPDLGGGVHLTITVVGVEETELLDGEKRSLTRIETKMDKLPITIVAWATEEGEALKTRMPVGGLVIETLATTKERALGARTEELAPDVFQRMLIVPEHSVPYPRRVDTALLRIRAEESLPELAQPHQVVEATRDGAAYVRIRRAQPPRGGTRPLEPAAAYAGCLDANSMIQSDAPEIQSIARDVVGDEKEAWRAARKLEGWVHENLTEKGLGVGFASALEVCRNREGDCTEHSVFLAALCRAAGIPARVAMGFEYIAGVWAGHAWNEVWIDGQWYPLDATNGRGSVDPLHLTLSTMTLEDADMGREFLGVATWIGKLEIDVEEVTYKGKTLRPAAPEAVTVNGDRYVNRLWGLAFTKPAAYEFDRKSPQGMTMRLLELDGQTASGSKVEIEIDVFDAPADGDWLGFLERLEWPEAREVEVDGRPARRTTLPRGERLQEIVAVLAGDALYLLRIDRVETPAEIKAFEAFLASIDFDVAR